MLPVCRHALWSQDRAEALDPTLRVHLPLGAVSRLLNQEKCLRLRRAGQLGIFPDAAAQYLMKAMVGNEA